MRFDKRHFKWWKQRRTRGFDDRELWNLDYTILKFVYPRLKAFRDKDCSYPGALTPEQWIDILDEILKGFEIVIEDEDYPCDKEKIEQVEISMDLFRDFFFHLWY